VSKTTQDPRSQAAPSPKPRTFIGALRELGASQKPSQGAPAYSRFVNRKLGRFIAAGAYVLGLTPNQITAISAFLTFGGIAVIATVTPNVVTAIVVALLLVFGYAFDAADGQLARLRGGGSIAGEWLDHVVDAVKSSALHAAVLICWFRFYELNPPMLLIPLGFTIVSAVFFFSMILSDQLRRLSRGSSAMILKRSGSTSPLYALAVIPADYGFLCLLFVLLAWSPGFVVLYAALFAANALILLASLVRWFRQMKALV
jgi:phosphatidylglycerophosphate synthase